MSLRPTTELFAVPITLPLYRVPNRDAEGHKRQTEEARTFFFYLTGICGTMIAIRQAVEKHPSAAFLSSFPVSSTGQACCDPLRYRAVVPQGVALLRTSRALHLGVFEQPAGNVGVSIWLIK